MDKLELIKAAIAADPKCEVGIDVVSEVSDSTGKRVTLTLNFVLTEEEYAEFEALHETA